MVQTNIALALASDPDNPITSAITSAINSITNNDSQNENTSNTTSTPAPTTTPSPTSSPQPNSDPITSPITQSSATPSASPSAITAPLTSPVLYEVNPSAAKFGDNVVIKTFYNILNSVEVYVGNILMPQNTYQYKDQNTSVSFNLTLNVLLENGKTYLVHLIDSVMGKSNSLPIAITAPVANPTPTPTPSASLVPASPSPNPTPTAVAPVINTIFPNPATWGTHIVITGSNITNSVRIYINESLITPQAYTSASADGTTIEFTLPTFSNYEANQTYKLYVKEGNLKSNEVDLTIAPSLAYNTATPSANQVEIQPQVNLDKNRTEVLMAYSNFNTNISIPRSVSNPTVNFSNLLISAGTFSFASFNNSLTINSNTTLGTIKVEIPTLTNIYGPTDWNGIINAPKIMPVTGIIPTPDKDKIAVTASVIEIGLGDTLITFNKAARILIPEQGGKLVGYQRGSEFTKITTNCSADTQTAGDSLPPEGDCYISSGNDLVIWTKHFTKFITYTQSSQNTSNSTSSSDSGSFESAQAPVCGDSKPVSAPKLVYASNTGRNEVTLVWTKALDPVSYYLVAYGTKAGVMEYGNPNIGPKDTISYIVKGLDNGKTYYFRIRAGNGCMPGEYSNEMAVKVAGDALSGPAKGFKSGVLASVKKDPAFQPITQAKPAPRMVKGYNSIFKRLFVLVRGFFDFL